MTFGREFAERGKIAKTLAAVAGPTLPDDAVFVSLLRDVGIDELLDQAAWHGISPLLYGRVSTCSAIENGFLTREQTEKLHRSSAAILAWNLLLQAELRRLSPLLEGAEVRFLLLKGLGVAEKLYPSIGLRPIGDIDFLIRKTDFATVSKLLSSIGYQPQDADSIQDQLERGFHVPFYHLERGVTVEVHWHISRKGHPNRIAITDPALVDSWWSRASEACVAGRKVLLQAPGDLLGHLCIHFLKHRFGFEDEKVNLTSRGALIQLSDIARCLVLYGSVIDWTEFEREADQYGLLDVMSVVIEIVRRTFPNDKAVIKNVAEANLPLSAEDESIAARIADRLFSQDSVLPANTEGIWKSFLVSLRNVFPPPQILAERYSVSPSSPTLPFYYALRPFQLAVRFGSPWSRVSRFQEDLTLNRWIVGKGA
ncbi:MAG TPA: nucleotidyltransferase family protein [Acidobacteriota bacterium]|nr:nucleotidyltransferase family protein [Acidobacteriota bacterium]